MRRTRELSRAVNLMAGREVRMAELKKFNRDLQDKIVRLQAALARSTDKPS